MVPLYENAVQYVLPSAMIDFKTERGVEWWVPGKPGRVIFKLFPYNEKEYTYT